MAVSRQDVEFPTLDGLTLRGWLFPAQTRGPAVIINPGFNCVKEMFVPQVAEQFQLANITALVYDPRSLGDSAGEPRNEIDPEKQVSDYSDALTYLKGVPIVDASAIGFWGMSFGGTVALCAATLDPRAKFCVAVCPLMGLEPNQTMLSRVLAKTMQDRESQIMGNLPACLPVLTDAGENPAGMGLGADKEEFDYMVNAKSKGAPNYENRTTLQTYYKMIAWQPFAIMKYMSSTPVLMIVPEKDMISPPEAQLALFETFAEPKKVHIAEGRGHLNVLSGDGYLELSELQANFIKGSR
ncbi:Alpha/Beta hydrolase protein [Dactylonectria estremocensis]|uniref:Alpha/Beta hydrolase protein n=1 Tax=Dactylonectria estremocensis TaxID=1079267 RepID=A0A9P9EQU6_9HYPO|nr:Alpha/Beta hydrolase protein [Dactylonectria estremocensis]